MEKIKVKRSILFQISYFRKSVVKKLRVVIILFRADKIDQFRHIKGGNDLSLSATDEKGELNSDAI